MSAQTVSLDSEALLAATVRDGIARAIAVVGLGGVALIHLLDAPGTFEDQAYKGWLYVGLITGCVLAAAALIRTSDSRAWLAAAALPLGAMTGYVVSRTIGLPGGADDIGNWGEPLGIASLFVEGSLAALAVAVLHSRTAVAPLTRRIEAVAR
jgi:hypothetical protein